VPTEAEERRRQELMISARSDCDVRTVRAYLAGGRVKPKSAERISAAIDALGLTNPIQPAAGA